MAKRHAEQYERRGETFSRILRRRLARRSFLKGAAATIPLLIVKPGRMVSSGQGVQSLAFQPVRLSAADAVLVPPGYSSQILIRWGDPLFPDAPEFNLLNQTASSQARQFGYNCDYVGYFPLPDHDSNNPTHGLLVVNHEFTSPELMFVRYSASAPTREQVDVELAAHGLSVVEVERTQAGEWKYHRDSFFNRRITGETEMLLTGPAAGHDLLKVSYDRTGTRVRGMLNNCAGGKTPWGTVLTCEENFNQYFANLNALPDSDRRKAMHARYGVPSGASERRWEQHHDRFDVGKEPNEPFRFGWVIEVDPYNPHFIPRKRTALGRFKHEAATVVVAPDGRVVVYSGDDERFEYIYKFVSRRPMNLTRRDANFGLLDEGTLYVAKFNDDGTGQWLPLQAGQGPLATWSQAEVLIYTRAAADVLGATKMDRPEDIEMNPITGKVYCVMTNNTRRGSSGQPGVNQANPRANNRHGHIIELTEDGGDPTSTTFRWEIFLLCGDPMVPGDQTFFAGFDPTLVSPISCPDNITFDGNGHLWIATDGMPGTFQKNDGLFAVPVEGEERGFVRQFLSGPVGAEICGPEFTPDYRTLFVAIQHPGEGSSLTAPTSTWPDGVIPPRPSVIAITTHNGLGAIGS
ncbi:MAG TPA: PhoX family phosphatase [Blastocatellia bacterium]|nr:PhoX family phosphatase [Blastocatellia bacterium]